MHHKLFIPPKLQPEGLSDLWQKQALADLKWMIQSPPLFDGPDGLIALTGNSLDSVDFHSSREVWQHQPPPKRVGYYFESLLAHYLVHGLQLEMEARHLQLFEGKRTIGEIDFCVKDANGTRWHLESTIKFYLHHPASASVLGSAFIGPDPRDHFERKHAHLTQRQLRLPIPDCEPVDHALPVARGILFYHVSTPHLTQRPVGAHARHQRGIWMRASEWNEAHMASLGIQHVVHLPKPYWLSGRFHPGLTSDALTWHDAGQAVQSHFQKTNAALMLSLREPGVEVPGAETQRCIVVHDQWPETPPTK